MGEVYRARDTRLGREVALKVLPAELSQDAGRLKRFEKEARAASALNHPNIVTIYDVGAEGGVSYIAMELVPGRTLREVLLSGALPPKKLLQIAAPIAEGLAAAHEAGIVHRDLKPENVMVARDGFVKVLDFGLAKLAAIGSGEDSLPTVSRTEPGGLLGTVSYMSPEQAAGQPADFRSDQFSLGSILWEVATGKKAFHRDTAVDTLAAILHEEPVSLSIAAPQTPVPLHWIVQRCLAKEPTERYASTRDLARDLAALREHVTTPGGEGVASPHAAAPRRTLMRIFLGGIVAAGFIGVFLAGRVTDPARNQMAKVSTRRVTFRRGNIVNARFAPDGDTIVYSAAWEGNPQELFVTSVRRPESRSLGLPNAQLLSVSEDGELAVLLKKDNLASKSGTGTLARVPLLGGTPREVMENSGWMADWGTRDRLAVTRETGGKTTLEYPIGKVFYETASVIHCPRVAPDGERIAFFDASQGEWTLVVVERSGKRTVLVRLADGFSGWGDLAWHPSGREIWFNAVPLDSDEGLFAVSLTGKLRTVLRPLGVFVLLDISRNGRLLLEAEEYRKELMFFGPGDRRERNLSWLDQSELRDLSHDGRMLLITEHGGSAAGNGVYLRKTDGSPAVRIANGLGQSLSPDGRSALVLVPSPGKATFELLRVPTGAGQPEPIPVGDLTVEYAAWIPPDGKQIFLSATKPNQPERGYVLDLASRQIRPLGPDSLENVGGFSPDGRTVTLAGPGLRYQIYPIDGGEPKAIPGLQDGELVSNYTKDGTALYVTRFGQVPIRIDRLELATGRRSLWKELSPSDPTGLIGVSGFGISSDDGSYAYNVERVISDDLYVIDGLR